MPVIPNFPQAGSKFPAVADFYFMALAEIGILTDYIYCT
jgi:hypothetical protein